MNLDPELAAFFPAPQPGATPPPHPSHAVLREGHRQIAAAFKPLQTAPQMDLFFLLRLSYYAMAATSALALSIATRNPFFVVGTVAGALLAHFTLDRRRAKPVRIEYIAV